MDNNIHVCNRCHFRGTMGNFDPSMGLYSDIKCPDCGSTDIDINFEYSKRMSEAMRKHEEGKE